MRIGATCMHVSSLPTAADADAAGPTALLLLLPPPLLLLLLLMPSSPARALLVCGCGASGSSRLLELLPIAAPPRSHLRLLPSCAGCCCSLRQVAEDWAHGGHHVPYLAGQQGSQEVAVA